MSWRDWLIFCLTMAAGCAICAVLRKISDSDVHVPLIFVLAVLIIALSTDGYFYGIFAALVSVFAVNWAFTYPYMKLDFSIYGYPLTFLTMLAVGIAASTLASRMKQQQKMELETQQERIRANLLRSVSHDIRTPLTAICGSVSAVIDEPDMPVNERNELLDNARHDAEWLRMMVENILSVTRISSSGPGKIVKQDELLEEVIESAVNKFKKRNPGANIRVQVPEEAVFVPVDAILTEQVLINLLDNAAQHGKTLTVIDVRCEDLGDCVSVCVEDDGVGIAPEFLGRLFTDSLGPQAGNASDSNRFMGIGLAVCRTIVEAHGGTIKGENRPEGGARFTFTLPKGENLYEYQG